MCCRVDFCHFSRNECIITGEKRNNQFIVVVALRNKLKLLMSKGKQVFSLKLEHMGIHLNLKHIIIRTDAAKLVLCFKAEPSHIRA